MLRRVLLGPLPDACQPVLGVRCFSARARRTVSASGPHGASQPVLGVRCGLHHCLLRAHALSPGARCCSACARPFARAPHGAPQPVLPHRNHDPALARTTGKPSHRKNTPQRRVGGRGSAENTRGSTHRENHRSGKTHRRSALGGKTALPHHAFRCLHTFHRSGGLSLSGTRDANHKKIGVSLIAS